MRKTTRTTSKSILDFPQYSPRITPDEGVNEGVKLGYDFIRAHGGCRLPHIARGTGLPEKTIERHPRLLRQRGDVEFHGAPKTGGYCAKAGEE